MLVQEVRLEAVQEVCAVAADQRQVMQVFGVLKLRVKRPLQPKGVA